MGIPSVALGLYKMKRGGYIRFIAMTILASALFLFSAGIAAGKTMYITDKLHASIRTGPSAENKIVAFVQSNSPVDVLEKSGKWTYIKLMNGKEGWTRSSFLAQGPTKEEIIERLKAENEKLNNELSLLKNEDTRLRRGFLEQKSKTEEQEKIVSDLTQKTEELSYNKPTRWLVLGASVLVTGILIGYYSKKKKKAMFLN